MIRVTTIIINAINNISKNINIFFPNGILGFISVRLS